MSERHLALVKDDTVVDLIVVNDETPSDFADRLVAARDLDRAVDVDGLAGPVAIGYVFRAGKGYVPPETIAADPATMPANGATPARITYTDNRPAPPATVAATVNGVERALPLDGNGVGTLEVVSTTAGDEVEVRIGRLGLTLTVEQ